MYDKTTMLAAIQVLTLLSLVILHRSDAFPVATNYLTSCAGSSINTQATKCPQNSIIKLMSLTIYASPDSTATNPGDNCLGIAQCKRVIHNAQDSGLSASYVHLYSWFQSLCEGKSICGEGTLPQWWELTGDTKDNAGESRNCPATGIKYFTAILLHLECVAGEEVSTVPPPPETSPLTRPTTPTSTTPFPVFIPLYIPVLGDREKVMLGIAIGLAIAIIIVLLLILYCCERYRKSKKFMKLLKTLGAPQAQDYLDDDDYSKTETWTDDHINPDALGEYTGVKPDEFLTVTKQTMMSTGQIMYDTTLGGTGYGRRNSCSTLSRRSSVDELPNVERGTGGYVGPMAYDTEENLELERRMAAVLDANDDDTENNSPRNNSPRNSTIDMEIEPSNCSTQSIYS